MSPKYSCAPLRKHEEDLLRHAYGFGAAPVVRAKPIGEEYRDDGLTSILPPKVSDLVVEIKQGPPPPVLVGGESPFLSVPVFSRGGMFILYGHALISRL